MRCQVPKVPFGIGVGVGVGNDVGLGVGLGEPLVELEPVDEQEERNRTETISKVAMICLLMILFSNLRKTSLS